MGDGLSQVHRLMDPRILALAAQSPYFGRGAAHGYGEPKSVRTITIRPEGQLVSPQQGNFALTPGPNGARKDLDTDHGAA